jgi:putative transposase
MHLVQRGNNRQRCFYREQDRDFYLFHLRQHAPKAGCVLHAYCLMSNHVHLLLTPKSQESCAALMKAIGQLHTQYVNRNYSRTGSLWEGRYRSCLVQAEDYLLTCYAYIDLNPVRAGMVSQPADYPWSSYSANAGVSKSALTTPHHEYLRLGITNDERGERYQELVRTLDGKRIDEIRAATNGNFVLGDARFTREMSAALGRRVERGSPGRPRRSKAAEDQLDLLVAAK